ncbi:MAG: PKD domain-containing protein, partial [Planctomycetota bacterium]
VSNSTLTFQVAVNDGTNTSYDTVQVTVNADDDAPSASAGSDQTVNEGTNVTLDASASSDPEGQGLTYTWTQTGGTNVTLSDASVAQPTFSAPEGVSNSTLTFQVAVNDGTTTSYDTVQVTVNADDDAPSASAGTDQTVNEGTSVTLDASGSSDPEGQGLTYTWTQTGGTNVTLSDAGASQPNFTAPEGVSNSTLTFQVAVNDGTNTSYDTVQVTVNADDDAPSASAGADQTVNEGTNVTLDASASSDPEGQGLTYTWTQTGGTNVTLSDATVAQPTFATPDVSADTALTFQVAVSDGTTTSYDTVRIDMQAVDNDPAPSVNSNSTENTPGDPNVQAQAEPKSPESVENETTDVQPEMINPLPDSPVSPPAETEPVAVTPEDSSPETPPEVSAPVVTITPPQPGEPPENPAIGPELDTPVGTDNAPPVQDVRPPDEPVRDDGAPDENTPAVSVLNEAPNALVGESAQDELPIEWDGTEELRILNPASNDERVDVSANDELDEAMAMEAWERQSADARETLYDRFDVNDEIELPEANFDASQLEELARYSNRSLDDLFEPTTNDMMLQESGHNDPRPHAGQSGSHLNRWQDPYEDQPGTADSTNSAESMTPALDHQQYTEDDELGRAEESGTATNTAGFISRLWLAVRGLSVRNRSNDGRDNEQQNRRR